MKSSWIMTDITALLYDAAEGISTVVFYDPEEQETVNISFKEAFVFKESNTPGETETTLVVDVVVSQHENGAIKRELNKASYGWSNIPEFPEKFYKLQVEGATVLDSLAADMTITASIKLKG